MSTCCLKEVEENCFVSEIRHKTSDERKRWGRTETAVRADAERSLERDSDWIELLGAVVVVVVVVHVLGVIVERAHRQRRRRRGRMRR